MAMLEPISGGGPQQGGAVARLAPPRLRPFATDDAGSGYFLSDYHHRHLVAALLRRLAEGKAVLLLTGEPAADGVLLERFINEERGSAIARVWWAAAGMTFSDVVRGYGERLSLPPEPEGAGIWTLLRISCARCATGHVRADPRACRGARCRQPRRVAGLYPARSAACDAAAAGGLVGRQRRHRRIALRLLATGDHRLMPIDRLEPEEVEAFIRYQLNALTPEESAAFVPETVRAIAAAARAAPPRSTAWHGRCSRAPRFSPRCLRRRRRSPTRRSPTRRSARTRRRRSLSLLEPLSEVPARRRRRSPAPWSSGSMSRQPRPAASSCSICCCSTRRDLRRRLPSWPRWRRQPAGSIRRRKPIRQARQAASVVQLPAETAAAAPAVRTPRRRHRRA